MKKTIDLELIVNDREDLKELMIHMLYKPDVVLTGLSNDNYKDTINYKLRFKANLILPERAELILPEDSENEKDLAMDGRSTKELKTSNSELVASKSELKEWCEELSNKVLQRG